MLRPGIRRLFRLGVRSAGARREQVDDELQLHIQLRTEYLERQGLSPAAAREEAFRMFGDLDGAREGMLREASGGDRRAGLRDWLDGLAHDVRYAALVLWRERAITAVVVIMLALGIGANAAMFGIVDRLLLRGPSGVREPERAVRLYMTAQVPGIGEFTTGTFGYATYLALKRASTLEGVAAWSSSEATLGQGDRARTIERGAATWDFFQLLGVAPIRGRTFSREEDDPAGAQPVAVLDYGLWRNEFGADEGIIGRRVMLGGLPYTVIGVMPEGFTGAGLARVDIWVPMSIRSVGITQDWPTSWSAQWLDVIARLAPGATLEAASAEAAALRRRAYTGDTPFERDAKFELLPLRYGDDGRERGEARVARWLLGVTATVLLIVVANVANLMLARAVSRRREIAVRLALGISRGRLVRLLIIESTLRAGLGGVAAVGVAWLCGDLIRRTLLPEFAWPDSPLDRRVLAMTAAAAVLSGVLVGLVPAWQSRGMRLTDALHGGARSGGGRRARLRTVLTGAQAALSVILLVGAGLFVRSLQHVQSLRHGFEPDRVLAVQLTWPSLSDIPDADRGAHRSARDAQVDATLAQVRALPGVQSAAISIGSPFRSRFSVRLRVPGWDSIPRLPGGGPYVAAVSPGFFETMGTRVLEGRIFGSDDRAGSEPVAVVSRLMAATLWPGRSPIGSCLHFGTPGPDSLPVPCSRVVGVVEDMRRDDLQEQPAMQYYVPLGQERGIGGRLLLVRPRGDASAFVPTLRRAAMQSLPGALFVNVVPYSSWIEPLVRPWRLGATLFGIFGLLALVVAALGLYSLMAYTVAQRTHELGVRRALGAATRDLLRLVLVRGVLTVAAGCAVGLAAALVGARFVSALLFETSPRDAGVFAVVTGTMLLVAVLSSLLPARRAAKVDPMVALRAE